MVGLALWWFFDFLRSSSTRSSSLRRVGDAYTVLCEASGGGSFRQCAVVQGMCVHKAIRRTACEHSQEKNQKGGIAIATARFAQQRGRGPIRASSRLQGKPCATKQLAEKENTVSKIRGARRRREDQNNTALHKQRRSRFEWNVIAGVTRP